jgi:hypothetical protein
MIPEPLLYQRLFLPKGEYLVFGLFRLPGSGADVRCCHGQSMLKLSCPVSGV